MQFQAVWDSNTYQASEEEVGVCPGELVPAPPAIASAQPLGRLACAPVLHGEYVLGVLVLCVRPLHVADVLLRQPLARSALGEVALPPRVVSSPLPPSSSC